MNFLLPTIFLARIAGVALLFFINPLLAAFLNMVLDASDGPLYKYFLKIPPLRAQFYDKSLDYLYYLGLMALAWHLNLPGLWLLTILLLYRSLGQLIFLVTRDRKWFVYFPNFFEYAVLALLVLRQWRLEAWLAMPLFDLSLALAIFLFKVWHETFLHRQQQTFFVFFWLPIFKFLRVPVLSQIKAEE